MSAARIADHPQHPHTLGEIVGYVVRRTVGDDGEILPGGGYDVEILRDAGRYGTALTLARAERVNGGWAVVDNVYACGCRS